MARIIKKKVLCRPTKAKWIGQSSLMDIGLAILLSKVALVIPSVCGPPHDFVLVRGPQAPVGHALGGPNTPLSTPHYIF